MKFSNFILIGLSVFCLILVGYLLNINSVEMEPENDSKTKVIIESSSNAIITSLETTETSLQISSVHTSESINSLPDEPIPSNITLEDKKTDLSISNKQQEIAEKKEKLKAQKKLRQEKNKIMKEDKNDLEATYIEDINLFKNMYENHHQDYIKPYFEMRGIAFRDNLSRQMLIEILISEIHPTPKNLEYNDTQINYYWTDSSIEIEVSYQNEIEQYSVDYYFDKKHIEIVALNSTVIASEFGIAFTPWGMINRDNINVELAYHTEFGFAPILSRSDQILTINYNANEDIFDRSLLECLLSLFGKNESSQLSIEDINSILVLTCPDIKDINELNRWSHLLALDINISNLNDTSQISNITSLEYLKISGEFEQFDLALISNLTNLKVLILQDVNVLNIDLLNELPYLGKLYFVQNNQLILLNEEQEKDYNFEVVLQNPQ